MGLCIKNCYQGPYTSFNKWREKVSEFAGYGNLRLREGYAINGVPWPKNKDALIILLTHSDCEGHISWKQCKSISERLKQLIPAFTCLGDPYYFEITKLFILGLELAYKNKEDIKFN
jgi:hypothetical protein